MVRRIKGMSLAIMIRLQVENEIKMHRIVVVVGLILAKLESWAVIENEIDAFLP